MDILHEEKRAEDVYACVDLLMARSNVSALDKRTRANAPNLGEQLCRICFISFKWEGLNKQEHLEDDCVKFDEP